MACASRAGSSPITFTTCAARGESDIGLGTDYDEALKKWDEIHNRKPRIAGTLLEAMEAWEKEALPTYQNTETKAGYRRQLNRLKPAFGAAT